MKLLHITDTYLYVDTSTELKGINTHASFHQVLKHARMHHNDMQLTILGGDMAQDEQLATYQGIHHAFEHWKVPFLLSPGNHSNLERIQDTLVGPLIDTHHWQHGVLIENWHCIALNSHDRGHIAGRLTENELARLQQRLQNTPAEHVLLAIHHHPLPVQCQWLDNIMLNNAYDLWDIIDKSGKVRVILHGHTHQEADRYRQQVRVLGTPATCIQFRPNQDTFTLDDQQPGYRWLQLHADGSLDTGIERIQGFHTDLSDLKVY